MFNVNLPSFFLVILLIQSSCANEDDVEDSMESESHESGIGESSPRLPVTPWRPQYFYGPMLPQHSPALIARTFPAFIPFTSCTSPNKETGICAESGACTRLGGRASGACPEGRICCINVVTNTCDDADRKVVTLDNTYWLSPTMGISSSTTGCALTVKLDAKLSEQRKAVCQVRLNFVLFTIAQPDTESVCNTDAFDVVGASNKIPTICGDNGGQHMYLNVPSSATSPTDLQLSFNFGTDSNPVRAWNILISMIPCDSPNLAPLDCLQYFTGRSGTVSSFNWRDVAGTDTRQLANQDYSICFKTIPGSRRTLCLAPCTVTSASLAFSISVSRTAGAVASPAGSSQLRPINCEKDYLVIPGGFNVGNPPSVNTMAFDRFCGENLNANAEVTALTSVCTTATPFRLLYRTSDDETEDKTAGVVDRGNLGFCLTFRNQ
ncbi:uncharacterized protein LOC130689675 [Daphnia carinata]|uniref:uncharacterized protein LOC130689675 n=1 Tax=Daphnia carinata TaxID=120202 RepID=UPI002868B035|nr:uncharacterized protein LOC130689675 [Daphnia carinata]